MSSIVAAASPTDPRILQSIFMEDANLPVGGANCHVTYNTVKTEIVSSEESQSPHYDNSSPCYTLLQPMQRNPSPVLTAGNTEDHIQRHFQRSPPPLVYDDPMQRRYQSSPRVFEDPGLKIETQFDDIPSGAVPQPTEYVPQVEQQPDNFEESVLRALQEEIDHICHILEISPGIWYIRKKFISEN